MTREAFVDAYNVPRGTMAKFDRYATMLAEWQQQMNLVGPSTLTEVWDRHFADSAQLASLVTDIAPEARKWLDLGSGAGFPALVLALMTPGHFTLVEATTKKCRFLEAVVHELELTNTVVHNGRIETMAVLPTTIVTARACAPLVKLFDWGYRHGRDSRWLLLKGRSAQIEVDEARLAFDFTADLIPSRTDPFARIVVAAGIRRRVR